MGDLKGVIIPIITPLIEGSFDVESFYNLSSGLIESGVDGIFILGTTGEFHRFNYESRAEIIECTVPLLSRKTIVVAGTTGNNLEETVDLTEVACKAGAHAAVIAPMFGKTGLNPLEYMAELSEETEIPLILYNNPGITEGRNMPIGDVCRLSKNNKIVAIKDSSGVLPYFRMLTLAAGKLSLFQGDEASLAKNIYLANGIVPGTGNVNPRLVVDIFNHSSRKILSP
ncbi:dihydrodipicolinate synthase family protein [Candidatus Woesearchaeota archaeon]|nr:dihydrodipicolinate synthase family protein [Candidatus Woesearchaeota archaeon]